MAAPAAEGGGLLPIGDEIVEVPDDNLRAEARDTQAPDNRRPLVYGERGAQAVRYLRHERLRAWLFRRMTQGISEVYGE